MMIGYAHGSPKSQDLEHQRAPLGEVGCTYVLEEDDFNAQSDPSS